ncbi:hypothetical protein SAMN05444008_11139 [Cnuella takakiae]|uniref:Lipoprotein n=1 Tax=Cnuella takakiae TaxID=1302690 RepID=A0A1M5DQJ3_9BACT|nr:hypothetical protein [Cnuella takakiae]OLY93907.1 hypothetical protein BUE76_19995 [Cnuella takakiae]SHF69121.1 hypothetical protein SAMN05444008_11139 [Cnuella takakiae]
MKKIASFLLLLLLFVTGCIDSDEEIAVNRDGSGVYSVKMDMSGMMDMLKELQGMAEKEADSSGAKPGAMLPDKPVDTTIRFSDMPASAEGVSEADKALLREGTLHMVMNMQEGQFKMDMRLPFKRPEDLVAIQGLMQRNGGIMGNMMKGLGPDAPTQEGMPDYNSIFDFTFKDGLLERKVNPERLKAFQENFQSDQMKEASAMFGESSIKTAIRLPRKIKKVEGPGAKPGTDNQTVLISSTLGQVLENPNALTFRVEY